MENLRHPVKEFPLECLLKAASHGAAGQLMDLHGRQKTLELRLKILVMLTLAAQHLGGLNNGLFINPDRHLAMLF